MADPVLLEVGDRYGADWFTRLSHSERRIVAAWLAENHLYATRDEMPLLGHPTDRVVRDLGVLERDGQMWATTHEPVEGQRDGRGQRIIQATPEVCAILGRAR